MNLVLAFFLGFIIVFFEAMRVRRIMYVDFLRGVSFSFFAMFVFVPIVIHGMGIEAGPRFYWIDWIKYNDTALSALAQIVALIGYLFIRLGFAFGARFSFVVGLANKVAISLGRLPVRVWLLLSLGLLMFSLASLVLYSLRRGAGIVTLVQTGGQVRVGQYVPGIEEASFTFLTYAMHSIAAAFILLGLLRQVRHGNPQLRRPLLLALTLGFYFAAMLSVCILWIRAGRLHILNFFLVLLIVWLKSRSTLLQLAAGISGVVLFFVVVLSGKYLLGIAPNEPALRGASDMVSLLASELAFPYLSLINTIALTQPYRWFLDIPLAFVYNFGVPLYVLVTGSPPQGLPPSVAKVNTMNILGTTDVGEIPVDIVTFGYFSAGLPGVVMYGFLFGMWIFFMERAFPYRAKGVLEVLRVAWIVFVSTVGVVYADPVNVLRDGLYLIMPTLIAVTLALLAPQRKGRDVTRKGHGT